MRPTRVQKLLLVLLIDGVLLLVGATGLELYLRLRGVPPYLRTYPGQHQDQAGRAPWLQPDEYFGWISNKTRSDINPQGFRDPTDFNILPPGANSGRTMILGDSFMWGANVEVSATVAQQLQRLVGADYQILNLGVPGWGIDQMYLAYLKYVAALHPKIVLLAYIDEDVARVLEAYRAEAGMTKPSFSIISGRLVLRDAHAGRSPLDGLIGKSILASRIAESVIRLTVARSIVCKIFETIGSDTASRGIRFAVMRIPTRELRGFGARVAWHQTGFETCVSSGGGQYLDPLADVMKVANWEDDFYVADGHTSAVGNKFLARWLLGRVFEPTRGSFH
jgi:hypothetical protein